MPRQSDGIVAFAIVGTVLLALLSIPNAAHAQIFWTPETIKTNLTLWLDADDASTITDTGGQVSVWADKSGNTNDATQAGGSRPITGTRTIGGLNVLDFSPTQHLDLSPIINVLGKQVWAIINIDSLAADFTVMGGGNVQNTVLTSGQIRNWANSSPWSPTDTKADQTAVTNVSYMIGFLSHTNAGSFKQFSVDGTLTANAGVWSGSGSLNMSAVADNQYAHLADGVIGEIVVTSSELSTEDRQKMEGFLAHKWGLEGKLPLDHPHKDAPPSTPFAGTVLTIR